MNNVTDVDTTNDCCSLGEASTVDDVGTTIDSCSDYFHWLEMFSLIHSLSSALVEFVDGYSTYSSLRWASVDERTDCLVLVAADRTRLG